jgi:tetratricopeptide (TPR) repeat protein
MARHDYSRAELEFRNASRLIPKDAESVYQLGLAYLGEGDLNNAAAALFRATQLDPSHRGARVKLAEMMARSGDAGLVKEAEKRMRDLVQSSPDDLDAVNTLALAELQLGDLPNAEAHLKGVLQRSPDNVSSAVGLAITYLEQHDIFKAEQVLKNAQVAAPHSANASTALAQLYALTGRWTEAEAALENALHISPNDPAALLGLGAVQRQLGKKEAAEQTYRKLAALPDKQYQHLHAAYLFAEGQRDQALKEFEGLAKKSAGDRASRNRLVAAYLLSGRTEAAQSVVSAALKSNPKDMDALLQRSQFLIAAGKIQEAENDLNQLLHFKPDLGEAHYLLAQVRESRGDRSRANTELADALRFNPALLPARIAFARRLALSGSCEAALAVLNSAPKGQDQNLSLILERNVANFSGGHTAAFREGVAQALRAARVPNTLLQDAVVKLTAKDYTGAHVSIEEVLKQDPDDVRAVKAKAFIYIAQRDPQQAVQFLIDYIPRSKSPAVEQFIGEWLWSSGRHAEARTAFARAKMLQPQYLPADLALARADINDGRTDLAWNTLSRVMRADPDNLSALMLLALLESKAGTYDAAIEHYRKAVRLDPHNPEALNNLAYLLADKGNQADEALKYAQQAVEGGSRNPDMLGTLGWVFYQKGLYRQAQQELQSAAEIDGNSTQANAIVRKYHLAMAYAKLGERKKGYELLLQALQQNHTMAEAEIAQAVFAGSRGQ